MKNKGMCEISVIIPVYNTEKYLEKCINSVLNQSFHQFEIILVEDGTKDNSAKICDLYAQKDSRVKVIHQENCGLALSRRNGVRKAAGKYVTFLDSDDWIDEEMLSALYKAIEENKADMACSQFKRVFPDGKEKKASSQFPDIVCDDLDSMVNHMHVTRYINASAGSKLIKKELINKVYFPDNLAIGEEHNMVSQLLWNASRVVITDAAYYNYYMRSDSISHAGYNRKYESSLENYIKIESDFERAFPKYKTYLRGFYAEYEMAVMTAMCRNKNYDWIVIKRLRNHMREQMTDICSNKTTPFYLKCCAVMICFVPGVFIILFRGLHLLTGR